MQPYIPLYLYYSFLILSVATFIIIAREVRHRFPENRSYVYGLIIWFLAQYLLGKYGFFVQGLGDIPPRIMLFVVPNVLFLLYLAFSQKGKQLSIQFGLVFLSAVQVFRLGVEMVLWQLDARELLPSVMSFEGRNFDVLVGLTAPAVAYLYSRGKISTRWMVAWNISGLVLVTNVVVHGMLSVPGIEVIQTNVPNFIVSYAPFNLLPGVLVPFAYALHIASLRKLLNR
jgi:hypothetical protein